MSDETTTEAPTVPDTIAIEPTPASALVVDDAQVPPSDVSPTDLPVGPVVSPDADLADPIYLTPNPSPEPDPITVAAVTVIDAKIDEYEPIVAHVLKSEVQAIATLIDHTVHKSFISVDEAEIVRAFRARLGI